MMRRLYNWTMHFASGPHALLALIAVSFAESSFFPIPPDVMLVPMILAQRDRAFKIAAWCAAASVVGGMLGYAIGALLYESVGQWLVQLYGYGDKIEQFRAWYADWGAWIILIKGLTPIPYKLVTIASGIAGYNFFLFVLLSLITRGARFFIEAWLLKRYGEPIRDFIEHKLEWVMASIGVAAVVGFVVVKFVL